MKRMRRYTGQILAHTLFLLFSLPVAPHPDIHLTSRSTHSFLPEGNEVRFQAKAPFHKFSGETRAVSGEVELPASGNFEEATGVAHIDAGSLRTGIRRRDNAMYRLLEVDRFPIIIYVLERIRVQKNNERGLPERIHLVGTLNVHGRERSTQVAALVRYKEASVIVEGDGELDIRDFGLDPPRFLLWRVQPVIQVSFRVVVKVPPRHLLGKPEEK